MDSIKKFIKEKNYWPQAVIAMIMGVVVASALTISKAVENPVHEENLFMEKYQNVDENINDILISQHKFMQKYDIKIDDTLKFGENSIGIKVIDKKNNSIIDNANVKILVTRPETTKLDQAIEDLKYENGVYVATPIEITKEGRWFIMPQVKIGELIGYKRFEYNGTKAKNFKRINFALEKL